MEALRVESDRFVRKRGAHNTEKRMRGCALPLSYRKKEVMRPEGEELSHSPVQPLTLHSYFVDDDNTVAGHHTGRAPRERDGDVIRKPGTDCVLHGHDFPTLEVIRHKNTVYRRGRIPQKKVVGACRVITEP